MQAHFKNALNMTGMEQTPKEATANRKMAKFVIKVWKHQPEGYGFLATRDRKTGEWVEHAHNSRCMKSILEMLIIWPREDFDIYFCVNTFSKPHRKRKFASPTSFGWCDVDDADPYSFEPGFSCLWETSPNRYQGIWRFNQLLNVDRAEAVSKHLAYSFNADKNCWSVTKLLRVPGSFNHKPQYDTPKVRTIYRDLTPIEPPKISVVRKSRNTRLRERNLQVPASLHEGLGIRNKRVAAIHRKYALKLNRFASGCIAHTRCELPDRSAISYAIVSGLHEVGATYDEMRDVLWASPYHQSKHGHDATKLDEELERIIAKLEDA